MMKQFNKLYSLLTAGIPLLLLLTGVLWQPFSFLDAMLCDNLYRQTQGVSPHIKIIAIDEETLDAYGNFETWSREKTAQTVNLLFEDPDHAPAIIGLDLLFTHDGDPETDRLLVDACKKADYAVMSSNIVYRGKTKVTKDGRIYYDDRNIALVERPYKTLDAVIDSGFANALIARDGNVRYSKLFEKYNEEVLENFAWKLYSAYERMEGRSPVVPPVDRQGQMVFFYSGGIGEFPHFSMSRVLSGQVPVSEFEDCIVLIGAYAPGFQDAYATSVKRGAQMYGVEIHANVIQALMEGKTAVPLPRISYCLAACAVMLIFSVLAQHQKLTYTLLEGVGLIAAHMALGRVLALHGYTITQLYFISVIILGMIYFVAVKYLAEKLRKLKLLAVFKTYVAPQIVDELAKDDQLTNRLGGEKRQVAVLFVDIRGFTSMSEGLPPEEVVKILNEYLALTTRCIFRHNGTLDKFIGDATMAVFNAPLDLPDYVLRAVSAALDMQSESETLSQRLFEQYGKTISFGIGINCGEAVIGNIGCEVRKDYTAIGDTVNTAARLESRAQKGEILISEQVKRQIEDQIVTEFVEEMELKGKTQKVKTYRVLKRKEDIAVG